MEEGGILTLKSYPAWQDNSVIIEVGDTGKGIPPEILNNIFNPFFTTRDKGVGLGLSIVQKIISYHKGNIEARNNLERGVTFTIRLPFKKMEYP
jgi:signal transduction histidine kinase